MENMPAISTPETHLCGLCNSIHPQRPAWILHNPDQTPTPVMICENQQYATSPYGPPPTCESVVSPTYEGTEPLPTYSAAIFEALGERIARLREQLNSPVEDLTLYSREDVEPLPAYTRYPVQSAEEERRMRLRRSIGQQLGLTSTPRGYQPPPPRPRRDLMAAPRPQLELSRKPHMGSGQTKPRPRQRQKYHHHGRASDVEDSINLICYGVALLAKKVIKASCWAKSEYRQRWQLNSRVRIGE